MNKNIVIFLLVCGITKVVNPIPSEWSCKAKFLLKTLWNSSIFQQKSSSRSACYHHAAPEQKHPVTSPVVEHSITQQSPVDCITVTHNHTPHNCLICTDTKQDTITLPCCNQKMCADCFSYICSSLEEEKDPNGIAHPSALRYIPDTAEQAKIQRYKRATPTTEPKFSWININGKWYFEDGFCWWRYNEHGTEKSPVAKWRFIRIPSCPFCRTSLIERHNT